jgi:hypothetical protein
MPNVTAPELPPTATHAERLTLALASVAAIVFLALGWWWPLGVAGSAILVNLVVQQIRENRERREGLERLERYLPSASESERREAIEAYQQRFPSWTVRRRLEQLGAGDDARVDSAAPSPQRSSTPAGLVQALASVVGVGVIIAAIAKADEAPYMLAVGGVLIVLATVSFVASRR